MNNVNCTAFGAKYLVQIPLCNFGAMRCAYCTLRVSLIRWGGVAKR